MRCDLCKIPVKGVFKRYIDPLEFSNSEWREKSIEDKVNILCGYEVKLEKSEQQDIFDFNGVIKKKVYIDDKGNTKEIVLKPKKLCKRCYEKYLV